MLPLWLTRPKLVLVGSQALKQVWDNLGLHLSESEQEAHIETVANILQTNLSNGRWHHATGAHRSAQPNDLELQQYAARVAGHYWAEHKQVAQLANKEQKPWEQLHQYLLRSAYHTLYARFGLPHDRALERAQDCAQQGCELIFRGWYPFDVPFKAWATRVLLNYICAREKRSTDLLDRGMFVEPISWDTQESKQIEEVLQLNDEHDQMFWRWEAQETLLAAVQQLSSEAQRQVIIQSFWYGRSAAEIAQELGKTPQAVYNLRYRALSALKHILGQPQVFSQ